ESAVRRIADALLRLAEQGDHVIGLDAGCRHDLLHDRIFEHLGERRLPAVQLRRLRGGGVDVLSAAWCHGRHSPGSDVIWPLESVPKRNRRGPHLIYATSIAD